MAPTLGLDIGGTKVLGVVLAPDGGVLGSERRSSPTGFGPLVEVVTTMVADLRAAHDVTAVGIGAAGLVDADGTVTYAPNMPGLRRAPLRAAVLERCGIPVVVDNDANVAAFGEVQHGAAAGARHALMVTLGTGIGGGIVLDGAIYRGAHGFAGEIGHFTVASDGPPCACGATGHWEAIASGHALGRMARELVARGRGDAILHRAGGSPDAVNAHHAGEAARDGDAAAIALLAEYADNVALGLAGLANILDPERIVIAGGLVELGPLLFDPLHEAFARHVEAVEYRPAIPIVAAMLGERAGAIGAAALARGLLPRA